MELIIYHKVFLKLIKAMGKETKAYGRNLSLRLILQYFLDGTDIL